MNGCIIAIPCINFKIKEGNSLLDKRYRLDMILSGLDGMER
jgi:hypothetical protein